MLYCVIQSMNGGSKDLTGGTAMIYTALTKKAMKVAYEAHHGQTDRSGTPYIFHPFHVAEQMDDELSVCTALLHDVIEDTEIIRKRFSSPPDRLLLQLHAAHSSLVLLSLLLLSDLRIGQQLPRLDRKSTRLNSSH